MKTDLNLPAALALLERHDVAMRNLMAARRERAKCADILCQAENALDHAMSRYQAENDTDVLCGELYHNATDALQGGVILAEAQLVLAEADLAAADAEVELLFAEREGMGLPVGAGGAS